jgi:hypothetical protein
MSTSIIPSLVFAGKQVTIYLGILTLIAGVIGGLLIVVVFLSLKTFRQSSCAFYLTVMSAVNVGQMVTGLLSRLMVSGFGIDWSLSSLSYCKFRFYFYHVCALTSMTCMCLATIDQYLATCSRPRWQHWSNIKLARRLLATFILIWILHNVPYIVYSNIVVTITTGKVTCMVTNNAYSQYFTDTIILTFEKLLPVCITFFFGFLAYRNVQQLTHRTLPLVRRELDKQLTVMVLVQVVFALFTIIPYTIVSILLLIPELTQYPVIAAQLQFTSALTVCLLYMYFAVSIHRLDGSDKRSFFLLL